MHNFRSRQFKTIFLLYAPQNIDSEQRFALFPLIGRAKILLKEMSNRGLQLKFLVVLHQNASLVTFVGRTGNDFIDVLRRAEVSMPSLLNATSQRSAAGKNVSPSANATAVLMAGSSSSSLPVFNVSGERLSHMDVPPGQLQPFGLSDKALSIEGEVTAPQRLSTVKQYRLLFQPQYLQPRRNQR